MSKEFELLKNLAYAIDNAFISSWQSTSAWKEELNAALDFIKTKSEQEPVTIP